MIKNENMNRVRIFLKYNPYLVETSISINEVEISCNSELYRYRNER